MGVHDRLRQILNNISGVESLTVTESQDRQRMTIEIGGRTADVPVEATDNEIRAAFRLPPIDYAETPSMSVTGLQSGAFQAKLAEMRAKMANKQTEALGKIDAAVTAGGAQMDDAVNGVTAKVDKEIADALQEFSFTTNGGPA